MNIAAFADQLHGEGYADRTVNEYTKWVRRLARWAHLNGLDLQTIEPHHIRRWIDQTVPPSRESRKQARAALTHYYRGRPDQPWEAIRVPAKRRPSPQPLTVTEAARLRDAATLVGGRKGTATLGLLYTGCRPSEVACWRWDGFTDDGMLRFWRTKNRSWHRLPVAAPLADALERFRPPGVTSGFLFVGNNGRPHVIATTVWTWVRSVAAVAGLEGVNPSRLRDTVAERVLEETGSIDVVAAVLGHMSTETTSRHYVRTSPSRLRSAIDVIEYGPA